MKLKIKFVLFLSSYFPLFLILMLKNWPNLWIILIVTVIGILCLVAWMMVFWAAKRRTNEKYIVLKSENRTKDSLNYLIPYIISFIGIDLSKWPDVLGLLILFIILFVVYINSNLIYINPMLSIFKYKIYYAEVMKPYMSDSSKEEIVILTKNRYIKNNKRIKLKEIENNVFMEA